MHRTEKFFKVLTKLSPRPSSWLCSPQWRRWSCAPPPRPWPGVWSLVSHLLRKVPLHDGQWVDRVPIGLWKSDEDQQQVGWGTRLAMGDHCLSTCFSWQPIWWNPPSFNQINLLLDQKFPFEVKSYLRHLPGETIVICDAWHWQSWNWKPPTQQGGYSNISNVC